MKDLRKSLSTVSYDPSQMERCVLVPGVSGGSIAFFATGIAFLGLAAFARMQAISGQPVSNLRCLGAKT